jgi:signal transduction histidine kinase
MIWIGTWGGGLDQFNKKTGKFSWLTTKQGLTQDNIDNLIVDKANNIWISYATGGVSKIDPVTKKILSFTIADGIYPYGQNEAITMSDGSLIFATTSIFTRITPDKIKDKKFIPPIFITNLKLFNQQVVVNGPDSILYTSINVARSITLNHDQNVFTLEYAALDMSSPDQRKYAYQLEGFDNGWQFVNSKREVTYTNLSPGHYTFKVKSVDRYGQWNEIKDPLQINILPPWWKTWWAYTLYALLFIMAVRAFVSYRSASLKKQNLVLEDKVVNRTDQLKRSLEELRSAQSQLIQSEKMASLGELTAGIAHEIQNPLNFVNNFSDVNQELLTEMKDEMDKGNINDARSIANDVIENEAKINHHGRRADAIVKGMLQHSRSSVGEKELTDINKLADEYLRLSYHGLRAKDNSFNAIIKTDFDNTIGKINIIPQDIGRVLLNLYNNAFYAVAEKKPPSPEGEHESPQTKYEPTVTVTTRLIQPPSGGRAVEIKVIDNGGGIPQKVIDKIFQPFFTTKPTGQGTGLGLSLSYDIIKAHGGEIKVETKENKESKFIIELPLKA